MLGQAKVLPLNMGWVVCINTLRRDEEVNDL